MMLKVKLVLPCAIAAAILSGCNSNTNSARDIKALCKEWVKKNNGSLENFKIVSTKSMKREDAKLVIEDKELERKTKLLVDVEFTAKDVKGFTTCYCDEAGKLVSEPYTFYMD